MTEDVHLRAELLHALRGDELAERAARLHYLSDNSTTSLAKRALMEQACRAADRAGEALAYARALRQETRADSEAWA